MLHQSRRNEREAIDTPATYPACEITLEVSWGRTGDISPNDIRTRWQRRHSRSTLSVRCFHSLYRRASLYTGVCCPRVTDVNQRRPNSGGLADRVSLSATKSAWIGWLMSKAASELAVVARAGEWLDGWERWPETPSRGRPPFPAQPRRYRRFAWLPLVAVNSSDSILHTLHPEWLRPTPLHELACPATLCCYSKCRSV